MRDSLAHSTPSRHSGGEGKPGYRVRLLEVVQLTPEGVAHRENGELCLLAWSRVRRALAAEVGEPEGVRTVVFDLVVALDDQGCDVYRFDCDPYADAMRAARAIEGGVGAERTAASIKSMASDGTSTRWYPDLGSLAEEAWAELRDA